MRNLPVIRIATILLSLIYLLDGSAMAQSAKSRKEPYSAYLFVYFTGNSGDEEAIRFATSSEGYYYKALNEVMTPDKTFREGTYVIYRNGTYYFFWSEDDTRSENHRVRYGTSNSPLGKITRPANNVVLEKDKSRGIYGAGHNSVIQLPGRDEWYIVYHRFNYPNGINMGESAGYHREVCIDKLEFKADGSIKKVQPTLEGIKPVSVSK